MLELVRFRLSRGRKLQGPDDQRRDVSSRADVSRVVDMKYDEFLQRVGQIAECVRQPVGNRKSCVISVEAEREQTPVGRLWTHHGHVASPLAHGQI